ncbi:MAG TPA: 30S ribosomal protein S8 [Candidatus Dormibacteraeota bacterium]|nr:30S ribosomal protein S8 [Candidatus Dormibacteraeota bacterium]
MSITSTDPIADMLSRIRNAMAVNKPEVSLPHSNVKESVARLLKDNNYVNDVKVDQEKTQKTLTIKLSRGSTNAQITEIVRLSKPGKRHYVSARMIPIVKRGRGMIIVSTSKGLMSGDQARDQHVGGELICRVY